MPPLTTRLSGLSLCPFLCVYLLFMCCFPAGPALCVTIRGINSLPADKLSQLLTLSGGSPVAQLERTSSAAATTAGSGSEGAASAGGMPAGAAAVQQGLSSAWAVTDVLQVRSCEVRTCGHPAAWPCITSTPGPAWQPPAHLSTTFDTAPAVPHLGTSVCLRCSPCHH